MLLHQSLGFGGNLKKAYQVHAAAAVQSTAQQTPAPVKGSWVRALRTLLLLLRLLAGHALLLQQHGQRPVGVRSLWRHHTHTHLHV